MTAFFEAGKGSTQRPTDIEKYKNNYDAIFGKKKIPDEKAEYTELEVIVDATNSTTTNSK